MIVAPSLLIDNFQLVMATHARTNYYNKNKYKSEANIERTDGGSK